MMRTFIAIEMPASVRNSIAALQETVRHFPVHVSWVKPENIHLTLKFLGEIEEKQVDSVYDALARVGAQTNAFSLSVETVGFFPNARRPRVLWVGIRESDGNLKRLAQAVEEELVSLGFKKENRAFHPHLTFGRVRDARNIETLVEAVQKYHFVPQPVRVSEMVFMKSTLMPKGAIYQPLKRVMFSAKG